MAWRRIEHRSEATRPPTQGSKWVGWSSALSLLFAYRADSSALGQFGAASFVDLLWDIAVGLAAEEKQLGTAGEPNHTWLGDLKRSREFYERPVPADDFAPVASASWRLTNHGGDDSEMKTRSCIYELRITLQEIRPPIWRLVQVPNTIRLCCLHDVL